MADYSGDVCISDFFNFSIDAVFPATSQIIEFVPNAQPQYAYINRISGYNPSTNAFNAIIGVIDESQALIPISITACTTLTAFNTSIDKVIKPAYGAYVAITASTYPVTAQLIIDGYLFNLC
jgi:hypothetical protein